MKIFNFDIDGKHFEFVCTSRNTRNGFAHDTTCIINGGDWENLTATRHYYNRTWERYAYQSVMLSLAGNEIARHMERVKNAFMLDRGYKRLTAKRKAEFEQYLDNECPNEDLRVWISVYEAIENDGIMEPPYPDWYGYRPRTFSPSYFA